MLLTERRSFIMYSLVLLVSIVVLPTGAFYYSYGFCRVCQSNISDQDCLQKSTYTPYCKPQHGTTCTKVYIKAKGVEKFIHECLHRGYCTNPDSYCRYVQSIGAMCTLKCCKTETCNSTHVNTAPQDCYFCKSQVSDRECWKNRIRMQCENGQTCAKAFYQINGAMHYYRGCIASIYCGDPDSYCKANPGRTKCAVFCCQNGYHCNGYGVRCHSCKSNTSYTGCITSEIKNTEQCDSDREYRCARASYRIQGEKNWTSTFLGCLPLKQCNASEYCKTAKGRTNCTTECCDGDYCIARPTEPTGPTGPTGPTVIQSRSSITISSSVLLIKSLLLLSLIIMRQ